MLISISLIDQRSGTDRLSSMSIVGRTYLERGRPVVILVQWRTGSGPSGPRNVRIRREDGSEVVRPFRGLRRTVITTMSARTGAPRPPVL